MGAVRRCVRWLGEMGEVVMEISGVGRRECGRGGTEVGRCKRGKMSLVWKTGQVTKVAIIDCKFGLFQDWVYSKIGFIPRLGL